MTLCALHNITLPTATAHLWRPTQRKRGDIPGVAEGLTILCTDGVVAWFINDLGTLLYGHIQRFDGKVEPLHGTFNVKLKETATTKARKRAAKPRKPTAVQAAVALIEEMLQNLKAQ